MKLYQLKCLYYWAGFGCLTKARCLTKPRSQQNSLVWIKQNDFSGLELYVWVFPCGEVHLLHSRKGWPPMWYRLHHRGWSYDPRARNNSITRIMWPLDNSHILLNLHNHYLHNCMHPYWSWCMDNSHILINPCKFFAYFLHEWFWLHRTSYSTSRIIWPSLIRTSRIIRAIVLYTRHWPSMLNCSFNSHAQLISTNFPRIFSANYPGYTVPLPRCGTGHLQKHNFFLKYFVGSRSILWSHWLPLFWTLCDPSHGFQSQGGSLACMLTFLCMVKLRVTSCATPAFSTNRGVHCISM